MFQNRVDNEWKRISYSQNEPNPYQFIQRSEYLSLIKLKKDNQYFREISNPILKNIGGDKYYETLIRAFKDLSVSIDHKQNQLLKDAVNNSNPFNVLIQLSKTHITSTINHIISSFIAYEIEGKKKIVFSNYLKERYSANISNSKKIIEFEKECEKFNLKIWDIDQLEDFYKQLFQDPDKNWTILNFEDVDNMHHPLNANYYGEAISHIAQLLHEEKISLKPSHGLEVIISIKN